MKNSFKKFENNAIISHLNSIKGGNKKPEVKSKKAKHEIQGHVTLIK